MSLCSSGVFLNYSNLECYNIAGLQQKFPEHLLVQFNMKESLVFLIWSQHQLKTARLPQLHKLLVKILFLFCKASATVKNKISSTSLLPRGYPQRRINGRQCAVKLQEFFAWEGMHGRTVNRWVLLYPLKSKLAFFPKYSPIHISIWNSPESKVCIVCSDWAGLTCIRIPECLDQEKKRTIWNTQQKQMCNCIARI